MINELWIVNFSDEVFDCGFTPEGPRVLSIIMHRTATILGIELSDHCKRALLRMKPNDPTPFHFHATCITILGEKVKHMNIIDHAQGYISPTCGFSAINKFEGALVSSPMNKFTLRNLAKEYILYWKSRGESTQSQTDFIDYLYQTAIKADPKDSHTLAQYAHFCFEFSDSVAAIEKSEEFFLRSISADTRHEWVIEKYGQMLKALALNKDCETIFQFHHHVSQKL